MGIILASSSPRRKKILENLGYNFHIVVPNIDEHNINNLNPIDYVIDVSKRKGLKIHQEYPNDFIISGDTIIEFNNKIIGKPISKEDAFRTLNILSGKSHYVISALSLTFSDNQMNIFEKYLDNIKKTLLDLSKKRVLILENSSSMLPVFIPAAARIFSFFSFS